jgi:3-hydroxyethyl bacteriochlorophyllide a dehydrogenase
VFEQPEQLVLTTLDLTPPGAADVVVDVQYSGISTGTERLLWTGRMPPFPGMGYPLVPGYETVGRVRVAGPESGLAVGDTVFVPGATCFGSVRGLFGGAAARLVVPGARVVSISADLGEQGVLLALAATAYHAIAPGGSVEAPEIVVGHGVLGRLLARIIVATGHPAPTVWESNPARRDAAQGYCVVAPDDDLRRDYARICDASGATGLIDTLVARLARGGEIVLAGFYSEPLSFAFPPAFMREARLRIAAQWAPRDLVAVKALVDTGRLSLAGLITHRHDATQADSAYRTAFGDPACLKMVLDWRAHA